MQACTFWPGSFSFRPTDRCDHALIPQEGLVKTNETENPTHTKKPNSHTNSAQKQARTHTHTLTQTHLCTHTHTLLHTPTRVAAIGDLHGDATATRKALRLARVLHPSRDIWTGGQTVVVQVGDQLDRGDDELEVSLAPRALSCPPPLSLSPCLSVISHSP